ncbi:MAG: type 1 glutamine amidotransferase, partial [Rhodospirillales bacterium]
EMARLTYCRIEKLSSLGFFNSRKDALEFVKDLEDLHKDPARRDIAWRLGVDRDVMDEDYRRIEVRNWIDKLVIPSMGG